jgi:protein-disulfide isomerase
MALLARLLMLAAAGLATGGCVARAAWNVVTLPVEVAAETVDVLTTSQSEADEKRGRELRKQEERRGRAARREAERQEQERKAAERAARRASDPGD